MLPKAHLTSTSRMSDSRWMTTPSWLSKSLRPFLYSSSVYSCHLDGRVVKNLSVQEIQETWIQSLGQGGSPGVGNGNPFQYSCLEISIDREAWRATGHRVTKSWTWLSAHTTLCKGDNQWGPAVQHREFSSYGDLDGWDEVGWEAGPREGICVCI